MFTPLADLMLDLPSNDEGYDDRIFKPVLVPLLPNMAAAGYGQRRVRLVDWLSIDYWDSDKQKLWILFEFLNELPFWPSTISVEYWHTSVFIRL